MRARVQRIVFEEETKGFVCARVQRTILRKKQKGSVRARVQCTVLSKVPMEPRGSMETPGAG